MPDLPSPQPAVHHEAITIFVDACTQSLIEARLLPGRSLTSIQRQLTTWLQQPETRLPQDLDQLKFYFGDMTAALNICSHTVRLDQPVLLAAIVEFLQLQLDYAEAHFNVTRPKSYHSQLVRSALGCEHFLGCVEECAPVLELLRMLGRLHNCAWSAQADCTALPALEEQLQLRLNTTHTLGSLDWPEQPFFGLAQWMGVLSQMQVSHHRYLLGLSRSILYDSTLSNLEADIQQLLSRSYRLQTSLNAELEQLNMGFTNGPDRLMESAMRLSLKCSQFTQTCISMLEVSASMLRPDFSKTQTHMFGLTLAEKDLLSQSMGRRGINTRHVAAALDKLAVYLKEKRVNLGQVTQEEVRFVDAHLNLVDLNAPRRELINERKKAAEQRLRMWRKRLDHLKSEAFGQKHKPHFVDQNSTDQNSVNQGSRFTMPFAIDSFWGILVLLMGSLVGCGVKTPLTSKVLDPRAEIPFRLPAQDRPQPRQQDLPDPVQLPSPEQSRYPNIDDIENAQTPAADLQDGQNSIESIESIESGQLERGQRESMDELRSPVPLGQQLQP